MVNGEVNWWVEDESYVLRAGTALVIRPNEKHGSRSGVLEPCEHYWLRLSFPDQRALPGLTRAQTASLKKAFEGFDRRAFPASAAVRDAFAQMVEEHRARGAHAALISRAALHVLLVSIVRDYEGRGERSEPVLVSTAIRQGTAAILRDLAHPPTVSQLAEELGMSETAFRKRFREEIGCSPLDYITRRRIQEAQRLLEQEGASIKEVAHRLGFSSRQYFSTVFKRVAGVSPGAFLVDV